MKRNLLFLFFFLLAFLNLPSVVFGQNSNEYYQNFVQNYHHYQELVEPFNAQKSRYQAYQSVVTLADFLESVKSLTAAEIDSLISYTAFIKSLLAEATQILNYRENYLYVKLDDQLAYLNSAKDKVQTLSSLTEAQSFLKELENHYQVISQASYEIKSIIEIGSAEKILANVKVEREKINNLLNEESTVSAQINAARERFVQQDKEIATVEGLISQGKQIQQQFSENQKASSLAAKIRQTVDNAYIKLAKIVAEYKNIIYSLRL